MPTGSDSLTNLHEHFGGFTACVIAITAVYVLILPVPPLVPERLMETAEGQTPNRIAKGELPHAKPDRSRGVERNIVVSAWDWGDEKTYLHELISSDR